MRLQEISFRKSRTGGLNRFSGDETGVLAIKMAVLTPVFLLLIGTAIDVGLFLRKQTLMQGAADAASMAAAKELSLTDTKRENLSAVAVAVATQFVQARRYRSGDNEISVETKVNDDPIEVKVKVSIPFAPMFGNLLGVVPSSLDGSSTARIIGKPNICVLGLNDSELGTISLEANARFKGQNCAIYSNSTHTNGLKSKNSAELEATFICSRGGREGGPGNFIPDPLVDCPSFDDPLADRPEPDAGICNPATPTTITADTNLAPGTYCGLTVSGGARVTMRDGIYVIKDLPLVVKDGASLIGQGAGLFFKGANATFTFEQLATISLTAPTTGAMAGLLVFSSRSQNEALSYRILSDDARLLLGTIYIPKGELMIDANKPVADQSAYTAIVADKMRLYGGPYLILNTNYDMSAVPVPKGIRGAGQPARLTD